MLLIEIMIVCVLFWGICYLNTGSDEKNINSFSSYPDEVQHIVKENPDLYGKIKSTTPFISFISNTFVFCVVFLIFGFFIRQEKFWYNFINLTILGECLNAFDFLVIDMIWWRNSKRIRFSGTENMPGIYKNPRKHVVFS